MLLALTISFGINVAFWGSLIYMLGKSDSPYMVVGRSAVFVAFMAGVHFIGYRLWRQQFVPTQGSSNDSPSRSLSPSIWPNTKAALLQQGIVLILALLMLDMGLTLSVAVTAILGYWLAFGIIVLRRLPSPTPNDMFLIRCGFPLIFFSAMAALPFVGRALGRW